MKKYWLVLILFLLSLLMGCTNAPEKNPQEEQPEQASVCPEGYYWIDSVKSCIFIEKS